MAEQARTVTISDSLCTRPIQKALSLGLGIGLALGLGGVLLHLPCSAATNALSGEEIPPLRPPRDLIPPSYWEQHSTSVVVLSVAGVALLGLGVWVVLKPRPAAVVPPEVQAREALAALRGRREDGEVLSRVSQILRRYLAAAFDLPAGEMTTTEFCAALTGSSPAGQELSQPVTDFLRACDQRKFSPAPPPATGSAVEQGFQFVELAQARRAQLRAAEAGEPNAKNLGR